MAIVSLYFTVLLVEITLVLFYVQVGFKTCFIRSTESVRTLNAAGCTKLVYLITIVDPKVNFFFLTHEKYLMIGTYKEFSFFIM